MAAFLDDGKWGDVRQQAYPEQVNREIDRLAAILQNAERDYVSLLVSAMRGVRPSTWGRLPQGLGLTDPHDRYSLASQPPSLEVGELDLRGFEMPNLLDRLVRQDYRRHRYLESQSEAELRERALDALLNTYEYEGPNEMAVYLNDERHLNATARLAEVLEELQIRHGAVPDGWLTSLAEAWGVKPNRPSTVRVLEWLKTVNRSSSDSIVKFGKEAHLQQLMDGRVRLAPASGYSDDRSLARAQKAEELVFTRQHVEELDGKRSEDHANEPLRRAVTHRAGTDAYVFCTSRRISARLFDDFAADACVIIRDRPEFLNRLTKATESALPNWRILGLDVRYLDAFEPAAASFRPLLDKPIKYEYQMEYRVAWLPPRPTMDLPVRWLEVGDLADIAELISV